MPDTELPAAAEARLPEGTKYTFTVPERSRQLPTDPKTITFVLVLLGQQQEAERAAEAKKTSAIWEVIKYSIVAVDGRALGWDAAAKETFLEGLSPKARTCVALGFSKLHNLEEQEQDDFLASMTASA